MDLPPLQLFNDAEGKTFKFKTLVQRMPRVVRNVIEDNADILSADQIQRLNALMSELHPAGSGTCREVQYLSATGKCPEQEKKLYNNMQPYVGKEWKETSWLYGEIYFYHRLLECVDYHTVGVPTYHYDIFNKSKVQAMTNTILNMEQLLLNHQNNSSGDSITPNSGIKLLHSSLWGNKVDLSLFTLTEASGQSTTQNDSCNILDDQSAAVYEYLRSECFTKEHNKASSHHHIRYDFILDNMGFELFSDWVLIDYLVTHSKTAAVDVKVVCHCKRYPYYVSDTTIADWDIMLTFLREKGSPVLQQFAHKIQSYLNNDVVVLKDDPFWCSTSEFCDMPQHLVDDIGDSSLVFVKGDLNYRKLISDRYWPHDTLFSKVLQKLYCNGQFPAKAVCALRALKCELVCSVPPEKCGMAEAADCDWLVSGQWGVVHFCKH